MICTIFLVTWSSLFGKYSWNTMNASVSGLPLLTTQKHYPTSTIPYNLSLCHVFVQFYLMRAEWCSIQDIDDDLSPCTGRRRTVRGIMFCRFSQFSQFCGVWSGPRRIIRTFLFLWTKPELFCPGASSHEKHDVKTSASNVHVQHNIFILPQPNNELLIEKLVDAWKYPLLIISHLPNKGLVSRILKTSNKNDMIYNFNILRKSVRFTVSLLNLQVLISLEHFEVLLPESSSSLPCY